MLYDEFVYTFKVVKVKDNNKNDYFHYIWKSFDTSIPNEYYGYGDTSLDSNDVEIKDEDYDYHNFSVGLFKKLEESNSFIEMEYEKCYEGYIRGWFNHNIVGEIDIFNIIKDINITGFSIKYFKLTKIVGYNVKGLIALNKKRDEWIQ